MKCTVEGKSGEDDIESFAARKMTSCAGVLSMKSAESMSQTHVVRALA